MDNLFEILLPLIFFAVYFLSTIFGKKNEGKDSGKPEEVPDDLRKIREELKRKIAERRKTSEQPQSTRTGPEPRDQSERGGSVLRESKERRGMVDERQEASDRGQPTRGGYPFPSQASTGSTIEQDLENQLEEVRRSKEKVDAARLDAKRKTSAIRSAAAKSKRARTNMSYRQFLREALDDPESLQKSFILYEVFGTPVGMRRDGQMRQSWDW